MKLTQLAFGMATFVPGVLALDKVVRGHASGPEGGAESARYCYTVWLRHLVLAHSSGLFRWPNVVAELGPGDSLGVGLAAVLSGVERYGAFDAVRTAPNERNQQVFDELVDLFRTRADIPDEQEFPLVNPRLDSYRFPAHILTDERLATALAPERLARLKAALGETHDPDSPITYVAPWWLKANSLGARKIDMVFSQAVLEHVDALEESYRAMREWLAPDGLMTHTIDFKSHGLADSWNGHWSYSDATWKLLRGKRPYMLNRQPHSAHLQLMQSTGFTVVLDCRYSSTSPLRKSQLAERFRTMSDEDFNTSGAFIVAVPSH